MLCAVSLVQCCLFLYSRILRKHSTDFFLFSCRHRHFFFFFFFFKLTFVNLHTRMELFWEQQLTFRSNLDFWELTNIWKWFSSETFSFILHDVKLQVLTLNGSEWLSRLGWPFHPRIWLFLSIGPLQELRHQLQSQQTVRISFLQKCCAGA